MNNLKSLKDYDIPGAVSVTLGNGGLPRVEVKTQRSTAEIYLHGAHVTGFQKNGEAPLLFMSGSSQFEAGKPIRGGVPIIFPWFGPRDGAAAHGFARVVEWNLAGTATLPDDRVKVRFELPESVTKENGLNARVGFAVTVGQILTMELDIRNTGDTEISFEDCLHTYLTVGDIGSVVVKGLKGVTYYDRLDNLARKVESNDEIRVGSEVDRTYQDTTGTVEIHDAKLRRKIVVEKGGSKSTVVWNPWIAKSKAMPDFGDEEYKGMICVESGNVAQNKVVLKAGEASALKVMLSSGPI